MIAAQIGVTEAKQVAELVGESAPGGGVRSEGDIASHPGVGACPSGGEN